MRALSSNFMQPTTVEARPASIDKLGYVPEIDGLRAVAVLSVMLCHLNRSLMPGGFVGVDVFFVISGYVVTASLSRDTSRAFFSMLMHFYARGFLRIIPALIVCLIITSLLTSLFIPSAWLTGVTKKTALYAFFGASNFVLFGADSYFSPRPEFNPFNHTWSLAIEEQFYLILPPILYLWARSRNWPGARRAICQNCVLAFCVASFACFLLSGAGQQEANFYLLPGRFWELGTRALLFQLRAAGKGRPLSEGQETLLLALGAAAIGAAVIFADRDAFPFPWSVPPALGSLMIIAAISGTSGAKASTSLITS